MDAGWADADQPSLVRPFLPDHLVRVNSTAGPAPAGSARGSARVSALRPYLLTGGRTRSAAATLEIEAQVATTDAGCAAIGTLVYEQRDIIDLCRRPVAVAELAATLGLHLGVVRVLVGDLLAAGHLAVRRPDALPHRNVQIIERVIRGLQTIE